MFQLLLLLLPIAAASGWLAGFRHQKTQSNANNATSIIPADYFVGLNYLINEQPDKAVDIFIKLLEVNSDTVETHLALGNLFRKRGEVDRAIRIHQNLIARPQLAKKQRVQALSELAKDYLSAGVLDRAERLFLELIETGEEIDQSYNYLLSIYQKQKDWKQAISIAQKLKLNSNVSNASLAHYYCELAEQTYQQGKLEETRAYIKLALGKDKNCVRASIITGKIAIDSGDFKQAIRAYKHIQDQDPDFISEVVAPLAECHHKLELHSDFIAYLQNCLEKYPRISLVLALSEYVRKWHGDHAAIEFISEQTHRCLSLRGVEHLIDLYLNNADNETKNKLVLLRGFICKLLKNKPVYRCISCGFAGKQLYWQCPSCKRWGVVKPIHGLEGD